MGLLDSLKVNKAVSVLVSEQHATSAEAKEAITRIKNAGPSAAPKLIAAFADAPNNPNLEGLLLHFLDNKSLPYYIDGLADEDRRVVTGVMRVLAKSGKYDASKLYELFGDPDIPRSALVQILLARKENLNPKGLLGLLERVDKDVRQLVFKVLDSVATTAIVPDLIRYTNSKDPVTRLYITKTLSRFSTTEVRDTLLRLLQDSHKGVRQTALEGLGRTTFPVSSKFIVPLLKDPDLTVQAKAIDTLIKIRDPDVVKYLIEILQDDSEYIRRAAVEVLNEVGDPRAIEDLLNAMRDKDWWVKVRAADALGSIGGPKVVEAVLKLINNEDEFLRRTAVEILNSIKDERAVNYLITALEDEDWWVRERAADALANLGDKRAVPALVAMLDKQDESASIAIKALGQLGATEAIDPLIECLRATTDDSIKKETMKALNKLTDQDHYDKVESALQEAMTGANREVTDLANQTMQTVLARFDGKPAPVSAASNPNNSQPSAETSQPAAPPAAATEAPLIIDADALQPGDVIDDRYRVVRQIGKGAFGVVLLVEDTMVHEEIILKFLNAHMASDEGVIERFVHELRFTRKITHKNVIRIYDFITFGKSYAISMEYFHSHSLAYEIKNGMNKDFERNVRLLIDICKGLAVAHHIDVVHRDIKPANILVDDDDLVKLVDFGLAAAASQGEASRLTKSGILVGTPTYMAPEQVRGRTIDTRTDIYSVGIVMYERVIDLSVTVPFATSVLSCGV
ncbi:MAG TPA: serine/threonine protein kinase, partial [Chromatiales bacterium]|nr:serine/threonine protein kinase [Chromatiales bacterium]